LAKHSPLLAAPARLLVLELWGIGDVALAIPFLREAAHHSEVTLLAKPHAAPLLRHFAPGVRHVAWTAPWTAFRRKYRVLRWPHAEIRGLLRTLRRHRFTIAASARRDPRDHLVLAFSGADQRVGFPRLGSAAVLTDALPPPPRPHRAAHWQQLAHAFGWELPAANLPARRGRRIVLHVGAGQPVRQWPRERFAAIAERLARAGWEPVLTDDRGEDLDALLALLAGADRFIGNDSGPGHLAALLGVPTFTVFGPQLPELFAPQHPDAAWVQGAPCRYKPCFDACRYPEPFCLTRLPVDEVWAAIERWLVGSQPQK
jgi:ADP-heptose:LPS heptosyltransferase